MAEVESPINILASEYKGDLDILKNMNPVSITKYNCKKLRELSIKYGINDSVTKKNFYDIKGRTIHTILEKLERFTIEDILEKVRRETEFKLPRESAIKKQAMPESVKRKLEGENGAGT